MSHKPFSLAVASDSESDETVMHDLNPSLVATRKLPRPGQSAQATKSTNRTVRKINSKKQDGEKARVRAPKTTNPSQIERKPLSERNTNIPRSENRGDEDQLSQDFDETAFENLEVVKPTLKRKASTQNAHESTATHKAKKAKSTEKLDDDKTTKKSKQSKKVPGKVPKDRKTDAKNKASTTSKTEPKESIAGSECDAPFDAAKLADRFKDINSVAELLEVIKASGDIFTTKPETFAKTIEEYNTKLPAAIAKHIEAIRSTRRSFGGQLDVSRPISEVCEDDDLSEESSLRLKQRLNALQNENKTLRTEYRKLHDLGVVEAEKNFDELQTISDARALAADNVIASLRAELDTQRETLAISEAQTQRNDQAAQNLTAANLKAEEVTKALHDLEREKKAVERELKQSEKKAAIQMERHDKEIELLRKQAYDDGLQKGQENARLEAEAQTAIVRAEVESSMRAQALKTPARPKRSDSAPSTPSEMLKTPASAWQARSQARRQANANKASDTVQALQIAQLKEDLYGDLTGLIIRHVQVTTERDTYDCLQTGRNGTLHFHLAIDKDPEDTYDTTEIEYSPQLSEDRDQDLIALMPDYLTEDLEFSRTNAAAFYGRVLDTLTKKRS